MKKTFTLFVCFILVSLIGFSQILPDNFSDKNNPGLPESFKSTKALKQRLDQIVYETYSLSTQQWSNDAKVAYTYNADGDVTSAVTYDYSGGTWVNDLKEECTYNGEGKIIQVIESDWDGSAWQLSKKCEYTYNVSGYIETKITSLYQSGNWANSLKSDYTYDGNGKLTLDFVSAWSTTKGWITDSKFEYTYDGNQRISTIDKSTIDLGMGEWNLSRRNAFTHDGNGNLIHRDDSQWIGSWDVYQYEEFTYSNTYVLADLLLPYSWLLQYFYFAHQLTGTIQYVYNYDVVNFVQYRRGTCTYTQQNVGINSHVLVGVSVYPNPATDLLNVTLPDASQTANIVLFDLYGRKVLECPVAHNQSISISHLPSGMYICNITAGNYTSTCKVQIH